MFKEKHPIPPPERGSHMTMAEFVERVDAGDFTDYDGFAEYATATHLAGIGRVNLDDIDVDQTHVVWYNK